MKDLTIRNPFYTSFAGFFYDVSKEIAVFVPLRKLRGLVYDQLVVNAADKIKGNQLIQQMVFLDSLDEILTKYLFEEDAESEVRRSILALQSRYPQWNSIDRRVFVLVTAINNALNAIEAAEVAVARSTTDDLTPLL